MFGQERLSTVRDFEEDVVDGGGVGGEVAFEVLLELVHHLLQLLESFLVLRAELE